MDKKVTILNSAQIAKMLIYMEATLFHELRHVRSIDEHIQYPRHDKYKTVLRRSQRKMKKRAALLEYLISEYKSIYALSLRKYF